MTSSSPLIRSHGIADRRVDPFSLLSASHQPPVSDDLDRRLTQSKSGSGRSRNASHDAPPVPRGGGGARLPASQSATFSDRERAPPRDRRDYAPDSPERTPNERDFAVDDRRYRTATHHRQQPQDGWRTDDREALTDMDDYRYERERRRPGEDHLGLSDASRRMNDFDRAGPRVLPRSGSGFRYDDPYYRGGGGGREGSFYDARDEVAYGSGHGRRQTNGSSSYDPRLRHAPSYNDFASPRSGNMGGSGGGRYRDDSHVYPSPPHGMRSSDGGSTYDGHGGGGRSLLSPASKYREPYGVDSSSSPRGAAAGGASFQTPPTAMPASFFGGASSPAQGLDRYAGSVHGSAKASDAIAASFANLAHAGSIDGHAGSIHGSMTGIPEPFKGPIHKCVRSLPLYSASQDKPDSPSSSSICKASRLWTRRAPTARPRSPSPTSRRWAGLSPSRFSRIWL